MNLILNEQLRGNKVSDYKKIPFFFNKNNEVLPLLDIYKDASCFLIASGPSFKDINKNLLKQPGIWTMALNNAVVSFRTNAVIIVDDPSRFTMSMWLDPSIQKFVPIRLINRPLWDNRYLYDKGQQWSLSTKTVKDCPNVVFYRRNEHFVPEQFLYEDTINWGNHKNFGGGRSVMLAALKVLFLLGFRNVYLLGVDFYMSEDKKYHFDEERTPSAIRCNMSTYEKMISWFKQLQPYFLKENFIVKNCNPESRLTAFPFIPYEDAIKEAIAVVGDTTKEKVKGLYTPIEERIAILTKVNSLRNINIPCPPQFSQLCVNPSPQTPPSPTQPPHIIMPPQNISISNNKPTLVIDENMKVIRTIPNQVDGSTNH